MPVDLLRLAGAAFLEQPASAVIVTDPSHRIAYWSKGAERLLEIYSDQAVGRQVEQVIPLADYRSAGAQGLRDVPTAWEPSQTITRGHRLLIESTCISLKNDQQTTVGFLFVMQDVSELRRVGEARARVEAASREKDKFIAMAAHELRTPIDVILGWTQMFRRGLVGEPEVPMAIATIEHNARSLSRLTEDMLDISRMAACKLRLEVRRVELLTVIRKAIDSLRPVAAGKQIRISAALDDGGGAVAGDPERLQQIVYNLLSNAIKFTPEAGCVEARLERAGAKARITISDTGPGISEAFLSRIFDPFSQADAVAKTRGGLGLGLAIVRHLVELHQGAIQVDSSRGRGTRFTVELPLWKELAVLQDESQVSHIHMANRSGLPLSGLRVLLVDDSRDLLEVLGAALTLYGAAVELATTTAEAIAVIEHWRPDVLVSDIVLQGEDGYTLINRVRDMEAEQGRRIPSIALSGYGMPEDQEYAISAGYQMFICKPVDLEQLEAAIALVARRAGR